MDDATDLEKIAASPGAWRDESSTTTAAVDAADMRRLADCLDGPEPTGEVPPMWLTATCLSWPPAEQLGADGHLLTGIGYPPMPDRRRMYAGGRIEVSAVAHEGQVVSRHTRVTNARATQGRSGPLLFATLEQRFTDADDNLLLREEQDLVYRSGPATGPAAPSALKNTSAECPPSETDLVLATDSVRLFRFSALTANSHRIHYDRNYAADVESLPGTLVHGPLIALFLLELARRTASARRVRAYDYRLRRLTTAGAVIRAHVADRGDMGWDVHADVNGTPVATGSILFEGA